MHSVRMGLVGCGKVGHTHALALRHLPESEFVAVCDADPQRAQAFAKEYGVIGFSDLNEMIAKCDLQAITICTPHPAHESPCLTAAQQGLHVLLEKPMASTLDACDRMLEAADRHKIKIGVISQRRLFEPVKRMKQAIEEGKIGQPILGTFSMYSYRDEAYYQSDPWRGKWASEGGGVLVNQSPHMLDMLQWFMGEIEEISGYWANLTHPYIEVEDTSVALIRFKSGALGNVVTSLCQKPGIHTQVHIHGSNGASVGVQTDTGATFVAGVNGIAHPPFTDLWTVPGEEDLLTVFQRQDHEAFSRIDATTHYHAVQIQDFIQAILEDRPPLVTGDEGRIVVAMFTAIYESQRTRQPIRFPL
jgi:UDP-N-acetyl-2-amino-2-deoxyglucuronate dehydrogenase